jgi:c-di-GMP-binding flagellar brake protein YcgR
MSDVEKRKNHRFQALLDVRILPGDGIPADLKLMTVDIATGGARCASNRPLDAGLALKLTLTLIGGDMRAPAKMDVEAAVLRCTEKPGAIESRRYEIALRFTHVNAEDRRRLQSYVNSL